MCYISGLEYPAYVESVPVSFITDESGGQIAVVPLDKEVDHTKVYVNPNDDDDDYEHDEEGAGEADDNETAVPLDVDDVEIMEIDDGDDDKSDSNVDKMDDDSGEDDSDDDDDGNDYLDDEDDSDDDYSVDEDEDEDDDYEDDDDDLDDSDYEFIPKSNVKLLLEKKSTDDDTVLGEGDHRGKQTVHRKRKPNFKEIAISDADNGSGMSTFDVH